MAAVIEIRFADPEFEKSFRVYANYLEDVAGVIGGRYGLEDSLVSGVQTAMRAHPGLRGIRRRKPSPRVAAELDRALQKAWSIGGRVGREVESDDYDEEANAWLPEQAYYAVHHGMRAVVLAATGAAPSEHRKILNVISSEVAGGRLIYPWSASCRGCPQMGTEAFDGVAGTGAIEVLSAPDSETSDERVCKLLKTTRKKELERHSAEQEAGAGTCQAQRQRCGQASEGREAAADDTVRFLLPHPQEGPLRRARRVRAWGGRNPGCAAVRRVAVDRYGRDTGRS
jgi:hypothetical protein